MVMEQHVLLDILCSLKFNFQDDTDGGHCRQDTELSLTSVWLCSLAGAGPNWGQLCVSQQDRVFEHLHFDTHLPYC